jgi:hypothetical protein
MAARTPDRPHQPLVHCPTCHRDRPAFEFTVSPTGQDMRHQWLFCLIEEPEIWE